MSHNSCTYIMTEVKKDKQTNKKELRKQPQTTKHQNTTEERKKERRGRGGIIKKRGMREGRKYNQEYISKIDKCNQSPPFTPVTSKVLNRGNTLQLSPRDL